MEVLTKLREAAGGFWLCLDTEERRLVAYFGVSLLSALVNVYLDAAERERARRETEKAYALANLVADGVLERINRA